MKNIEYNYNAKELNNKIIETIGFIKAQIEKNKYTIANHMIDKFIKFDYESKLKKASKRLKKRINRQIYRVNTKQSLCSFNLFIHFLRTKVINEGLKPIKILPSIKERTIQVKRKEWLELRDKAEEALHVYKKEKGNFYKKEVAV